MENISPSPNTSVDSHQEDQKLSVSLPPREPASSWQTELRLRAVAHRQTHPSIPYPPLPFRCLEAGDQRNVVVACLKSARARIQGDWLVKDFAERFW